MLKTLLAHPELGYNASLEIISDIFFLSQCSTLLGTYWIYTNVCTAFDLMTIMYVCRHSRVAGVPNVRGPVQCVRYPNLRSGRGNLSVAIVLLLMVM